MQQEQEKAAEESSELHQRIESLHSARERDKQDAAEWEKRALDLRAEMGTMQEWKELEILRAVAEEKARWETREEHLVALLEQLQEQLGVMANPKTPSQATNHSWHHRQGCLCRT